MSAEGSLAGARVAGGGSGAWAAVGDAVVGAGSAGDPDHSAEAGSEIGSGGGD
jgi:hypothetical protein